MTAKKGNKQKASSAKMSLKQAVAMVASSSKRITKKKKVRSAKSAGLSSVLAAAMTPRRARVPQFTANRGNPVVSHSEYIGDITGSTAFSNAQYSLNPGLLSTFPWLGTVAGAWENYDWKKLQFRFVSTSGTAVGSTSTALGSVMMATQYDISDTAFANKQSILNFEGAVDGAACKSLTHDALRGYLRPEKSFFTRVGTVPSGYDPRLYDMGVFSIATAGMQGANVVGELWVDYSVELIKPKLTGASASGSAHVSSVTSVTGTNPIGTVALTTTPSSGISVTRLSGTTFSINQLGNFLVSMNWTSSANIAAIPTIGFTTNATALNFLNQDGASTNAVYVSTNASLFFGVSTSAGTCVLTVGGLTSMAACALDIFVTQIPLGYTVQRTIPDSERELMKRLEALELCLSQRSGEDDESYDFDRECESKGRRKKIY